MALGEIAFTKKSHIVTLRQNKRLHELVMQIQISFLYLLLLFFSETIVIFPIMSFAL
jgi:hypothetical protein